jgi:hypothetical protein
MCACIFGLILGTFTASNMGLDMLKRGHEGSR